MVTYYCNADTGDNGNDGSIDSPFLTLEYAIDEGSSSDTIYLQNSTAVYDITARINFKVLTIEGESTSGAVLDGTSLGVDGCFSFHKGGTTTSYIKNLTFQNFTPGNSGLMYTAHPAGVVNLKISDCIFHDIAGVSFSYPLLMQGFGEVEITACLFYNLTYGMYILACVNTILNNTTWYLTNATINPRSISASWVELNNNILISTTTTVNTCHYLNRETGSNNCVQNITRIDNLTDTIEEDPLMIDPANANFNLAPDSPCIDTGILI